MALDRRRRKKTPAKRTPSRLGLLVAALLMALLGCYLVVLDMSRPHVRGDSLRFDRFLDAVNSGQVKTVRLLDEDSYATGTYIRGDGTIARYNAPLLRGYQGKLIDDLVANRIPTTVDQQVKKRVASLAAVLLPGLAILVLFGYLIVSSRRGTGLFGIRSGARKVEPGEAGVRFADVAGHDAAVEELKEVKGFLADPQLFVALDAQVPKGVLLYGPPGCGKTMLAKALAGEAGCSFYSISGSDFVEVYVGVGASRVRDLFKQARANAPALIFIDELDSIGRARGTAATMGTNTEQEQALNQILAEMDGFSSSDGIIVVGATNRPDVLDPALLRPGRFDRTIGLARPDEKARAAILAVHAQRKPLAEGADLAAVAHRAVGLTGADLASLVNEAALLAARAGRREISQAELDQALLHVLGAPERRRRLSIRESAIGRRFSEDEKATFADVAGQEAAVEELREVKDFLCQPERFAVVGAEVPKGILLYGPPGCGKTLLARALAGESNAAFFSVAASEFVEVFVGRGAARVRDVFAEAKSMTPAIIFIDELDAIGRQRVTSGAVQANTEHEQTLNQILAEMDGFSPSDGVIVVGATNRPDVLDPALLRPGRFDRAIGLALPSEPARLAILSLHAQHKALDGEVDLGAIARHAIGLTGADLVSVLNEGALLAVRAGHAAIGQAQLDQALARVLKAPGDQRRLSLRGRSIGRRSVGDERATFADVAGMDDAVAELAEVKDYLAQPERFTRLGARSPRGILLSGPPGCGKTLLARAVAGEANAAFFSVAGSEFVEVFVGEGASRVRELFAEARAVAPSIVFIDEIDAVGGRRSSVSWAGSREAEQTLNQILVELDGFEAGTPVIVMAATNRPDMLDEALVRPGRFDRHVEIAPPDPLGRRQILELHAGGGPLAGDVNFEVLAGMTRGFSGADLANVVNEAALLAARRGLDEVPMALLEEGIDRATMGVGSRGYILSDEEHRVVAYHESGHGLVALALCPARPPHRLTTVQRARSLGHTLLLDSQDRVLKSRSALIDEMAVCLGGKVAEELVFGESGSGAAGDLEPVTEIARRMVCEYGMSEALGSLAYPDVIGADGRARRAYSDESARMIDVEVRTLVDEAASRARGVLAGSRRALDDVARALMEQETLSLEELQKLAGSGPPKGSFR